MYSVRNPKLCVFVFFFNCVLSSRCFASSPSNINFKTHAQFADSLKSTRSIGFKTKSNILGTALNSKQFVFFFAMLRSLFALFLFLAFFFSRQSKKPLKTIHLTFAHKKQRVNNRWYLCCLQFPCVVVVVCFLFGWCVDFFVCVYSTTIGLLVLKCWLMLVRITLLNSTKEGHCFLLLFPSNRWSSF